MYGWCGELSNLCYTRNLLGKQLRSMQVAGMRNFRESWVKGSSIYIIKEKFKKEKNYYKT